MRNITKIVVHHSFTPRDMHITRAIASFNANHKTRLFDTFKQPLSGVHGSEYVAYHIVISGAGEAYFARLFEAVGYHAGNYQTNLESIGICLLGNFDEESPSTEQLAILNSIIRDLKKQFPTISEVTGHRHWDHSKSCPGWNFTDDMIQGLNDIVDPPMPAWISFFLPSLEEQLKRTDRALRRNLSANRKRSLQRKRERILKRMIS